MSSSTPRNVEEIYDDYTARRTGLIKALTTDVERFYTECDPDKENLCLYGNPDGSWEVALPAEEVPPELPEPALGINFARDGMRRQDWLSLVAVHSDAWLMAVSTYFGAKLNRGEREQLFRRMNTLPTVYEALGGRGTQKKPGSGRTNGGGTAKRERGREDDVKGRSKQSPGQILSANVSLSSLQGRQVELFWPDDGLWYPAEIQRTNFRNRTAEVLYATGDVETLDLDEMIADGAMNIINE